MGSTLLFGGTFDPVHLGHLITAQSAMEKLNARRVVLMPARRSPHKPGVLMADGRHRLAMLRLAVEHVPHFTVDDWELNHDGVSYTIDTVEALQARCPGEKIVLLLGLDQLPALHTWRRVGELLEKVDVAVLGRSGVERWFAGDLQEALGPAAAEKVLSNVLDTPVIDVSATDIRARVAAGKSVDFLVPAPVAEYIAKHHLYRREGSPAGREGPT